ncbi:MAG: transcription elongation factor GreA [Ruminococcaceae bacterium]|nr:transcription elongation factor GreA [Oscillospiraceae bacterium]
MKKTIVTKEGLKKLQDELNELKTVTRVKVGDDLKKARAFGDLSENSEYDEAKNEQAKVEGRILELEEILKNVEVVENTKTATIGFGSVVVVVDESKKTAQYTIVGAAEANFLENRISNESPIGAALFGKKAGDTVEFTTPSGVRALKIMSVSHE